MVGLAGIAVSGELALRRSDKAHNRYKWRDGQGNLTTTTSCRDEALKSATTSSTPQGMVVKHVDRARTPEEWQAAKSRGGKSRRRRSARRTNRRADQQMLAAYPHEEDLASAQREQLAVIDQTVQATQASLQNQEKSLSEMLAHAADLDRTGKPVPATLQQQIDALRVGIEKQKAYIANKNAEKDSSAKRFETELAHYRECRRRTGSQ